MEIIIAFLIVILGIIWWVGSQHKKDAKFYRTQLVTLLSKTRRTSIIQIESLIDRKRIQGKPIIY